ncbi:DUF7146 domain-containing protein [Yunchengibacter salinarum]|uniref:DUF7146 domain-containing protein n=1 Tax=Yunchengibacter salinarum TaxID=3133399 RepID=UPI0035B667A2
MSDARTLTAALRGRWYGHYGTAFCPAHPNSRTPALSLADGGGGRLLLTCHAGCTFDAILAALKARGLVDGTAPAPDPLAPARQQAEARHRADQRARQAGEIWQAAQPIEGTPGERYLRGRGVTCPLPGSLRFLPDCWHGPTGQRLPAMIARIDGADGFGVHRTYLSRDGRKAAVAPAKAMLGHAVGGAVRLTDGGPLVVCEGIETGLSLANGLMDGPRTIWAALSTSGIKRLRLPCAPGRLTVAPDGDPPGREAGADLVGRARALGWDCWALPVPNGQDWNDILQKGAA